MVGQKAKIIKWILSDITGIVSVTRMEEKEEKEHKGRRERKEGRGLYLYCFTEEYVHG